MVWKKLMSFFVCNVFEMKVLQQYGIGLEQFGEAPVVATAGIVFGPKFGSRFGEGVGKDLLAVFHYEADFRAIAEGVGPKPEVIGRRREFKGLGSVENVGMQTMGRIKDSVTTAEGVFESGPGI